jgi:hypothetical protein
MVERVAILKLLPEHATPEGRADVAHRALDALRPLPGVMSLTAGVPADEASLASWDVVITVRCATLADLEAYRAHPAHRRFVEEVVVPRSQVRKAWSFQVETR